MRSPVGHVIGHYACVPSAGNTFHEPVLRDTRLIPIALVALVTPLLIGWYMGIALVGIVGVTVLIFLGVMALAAVRLPEWQGSPSEQRRAVAATTGMVVVLFGVAAVIRLAI